MQGGRFDMKTVFRGMGIPIINIALLLHYFIFIIEIYLLERRHLHIQTVP